MTAHPVKLDSGTTYPITSDSWTISLTAHGPGQSHPYPKIQAAKNDTITFKVVPNPYDVTFASFCAVSGQKKPLPTQACDKVFSASGTGTQTLVVTDNSSTQGDYYYVISFNKDKNGNDVGPLDPIIINNRAEPMIIWTTSRIAEVAVGALVVVLLVFFAWRWFGARTKP